VFLARELNAPEHIINNSAELTPDYLTTHYPDAAIGAPFENYTREGAEKHLKMAEEVYQWTKQQQIGIIQQATREGIELTV